MRSGIPLLLCAVVLLTACSSWSKFPEVETSYVTDSGSDCAGLDDEILKANALRDAITDERRKRRAHGVAETTLVAVSSPLTGLLQAGRVAMAQRRYVKASTAAEERMQHLLTMKQENDCPQTPTGDPDLTEYEILGQLDALREQTQSDEAPTVQDGLSRQALFDSLR